MGEKNGKVGRTIENKKGQDGGFINMYVRRKVKKEKRSVLGSV